jgi:pimeloyl-ACP methyl ester carboxylesterase
VSQPPFPSTPPWEPAAPQNPPQAQPTGPQAQVPQQSGGTQGQVPQQPTGPQAQVPQQPVGPQVPQPGPQQPLPYGSAPNPYGQPNPYSPPNPYGQPNPYAPQQPAAPSHLGANGALQSYGMVPGAGQQRPGSGYYAPQGSQPVGPTWGSHAPAVPPTPPRRSKTGLIIGVSALLVVALVAAVVFAGGYAGKLFGAGSTPSVSTTATSTATPSPTTTGTPGQVISKPPVPAPTATTVRSFNSPDRPKSAIPSVKPAGFVNAPAGSGISRYTSQKVTWTSCQIVKTTAQCATIEAPLDYATPDGQALTLKLAKVVATKTPKLGTIFVNPGGPGVAGIEWAVDFERTGLEQYDIVAWDPRGVGGSTPVVCENGPAADQLLQLDGSPDNAAEKQALLDGWKAFGASCLAKSGALLLHISTVDTVQDLDMMRQLVGDAKLNFVGYSYGTYIGAVYAQKFPANVGKLLLDSPVNLTMDESVIQASGFDLALGNYAAFCAAKKCSLGTTKQAVIDKITKLLDNLDAAPLRGDATRKLTQTLALDGIAYLLYFDEQQWDALTQALAKAIAGDGRYLLQLSDAMRHRQADGQYDPLLGAFPATGCTDSQDDGIARAFSDWASDQQKAPIFGKYSGPNIACVQWPVQGQAPFDITGKGAPPIVVVGALGDSATPYQQAAWMSDQLESAVLVTYSGNGHGTYGAGKSTCVDNAVVSYFAKGTVPPDGLFCSK